MKILRYLDPEQFRIRPGDPITIHDIDLDKEVVMIGNHRYTEADALEEALEAERTAVERFTRDAERRRAQERVPA